MAIQVLLADDHGIVREGLVSLLEKESDIDVVGEAENGRETLKLIEQLDPDLVIMDVSMPGLNGVEATRQIKHDYPKTKVLALSMHSDRRFVARMLEAGASGYLVKRGAFSELANAIRTVANNQTYLCPSVASIVVEGYVRRTVQQEDPTASPLSSREREVLQLLAEGCSTKEIAEKLHISVKTVESHRRQIMDKLEIRTIAGLTRYAVREGLVSLES